MRIGVSHADTILIKDKGLGFQAMQRGFHPEENRGDFPACSAGAERIADHILNLAARRSGSEGTTR
jgi:hypothetical protein